MRTSRCFAVLFVTCVLSSACTKPVAKYPPPVYQEPSLPIWEPPTSAPTEDDPFDAADLDGEWVADPSDAGASPEKAHLHQADDVAPPPEGSAKEGPPAPDSGTGDAPNPPSADSSQTSGPSTSPATSPETTQK